jgi:hypothetical protein
MPMPFYGVFDHGAASIVSEEIDLMADTIKVRFLQMTDQPDIYDGYAPDLVNHQFLADDIGLQWEGGTDFELTHELTNKAFSGGVFSATEPFILAVTGSGFLYAWPLVEDAPSGFGMLVFRDTGDIATSNLIALLQIGESDHYAYASSYQQIWFNAGNLFSVAV